MPDIPWSIKTSENRKPIVDLPSVNCNPPSTVPGRAQDSLLSSQFSYTLVRIAPASQEDIFMIVLLGMLEGEMPNESVSPVQ